MNSVERNQIPVALEYHPISNSFPLVEGEDLQELVNDIRRHGLLQPVVLFEGKILDGRSRYRACQLAGVEPKYVELAGTPEEAISRAWSLNYLRRHLTSDQRACCDAMRSEIHNPDGQREDEERRRKNLSRKRLLDVARMCAARIAHQEGRVTNDDVCAEMLRLGLDPKQLGPAIGGVFKTKEFIFTGSWRKSKRASNHARMLRVWKLRSESVVRLKEKGGISNGSFNQVN